MYLLTYIKSKLNLAMFNYRTWIPITDKTKYIEVRTIPMV